MARVQEILGFPRHLSQHVGDLSSAAADFESGTRENASMPDRTVIQWDKEDIEALGLLKVDILALGMLSAIRKSLDMISRDRLIFAAYRISPKKMPPPTECCKRPTLWVSFRSSRARKCRCCRD